MGITSRDWGQARNNGPQMKACSQAVRPLHGHRLGAAGRGARLENRFAEFEARMCVLGAQLGSEDT